MSLVPGIITIDRLVFDGPALTSDEASGLARALESELSRLLSERPLAPSAGKTFVSQVQADAVEWDGRSASSMELARGLAARVAKSLPGAGHSTPRS